MKPTLLFATLSMMFALPQAFAATELESLRARCAQQEVQIRHLEDQIQELQSGKSSKSSLVSTSQVKPMEVTAGIHTVRAGESLGRIARRVGCSPESLAKTNGIKLSAAIHPGQKLKLPAGTVAQTATSAPTPAVAKVAAPSVSPATGKTHTIRAGETYGSISRKHKVSVASLIAANPGVKATSLRPGQVIKLSSSATVSAPAPQAKPSPQIAAAQPAPAPRHQSATTTISTTRTPVSAPLPEVSKPAPAPASSTMSAPPVQEKPVQTAETSPAPENSSSPSNPEKKIRSVTIEGEMTYGEFAATHGTDTDRLNDLNGLDLTNATVLAKGSELYVPAQP